MLKLSFALQIQTLRFVDEEVKPLCLDNLRPGTLGQAATGTRSAVPVQCRHDEVKDCENATCPQTTSSFIESLSEMPSLDPLTSVEQALRDNRIVPDIIPADPSFRISTLFSVTWGETDSEVMLGNELTVADVQSEPKVLITPMSMGGSGFEDERRLSYTVALVDSDAPSHDDRSLSPFRHWLMSGLIPPTAGEMISSASATKDIMDPSMDPLSAASTRPAISSYIPPDPNGGTGIHRYVFLLFQEPMGGFAGKIPAEEDIGDRSKWSAVDFARKHRLTLVGANFFTIRASTAMDN